MEKTRSEGAPRRMANAQKKLKVSKGNNIYPCPLCWGIDPQEMADAREPLKSAKTQTRME